MKKICGWFFIFSLFSTCAFADGDGGNTGLAYTQNSPMMQEINAKFKGDGAFKKYRWSWGAVGEVYKAMIDQCHSVESAELKYMGNWFRQNGNVFSLYDLISVCKKAGFQKIDRNYVSDSGKKYKCQLPTAKCDVYNGCGEVNFTGHAHVNLSGCNVFISTLISKNNDAKVGAASISKKVGTFVEKVKDGVYRVVDVVLPNDYWKNGELNYDANTDQKNTKIYEIYTDKDGKHNVKDTGWHTWTADMFFDVSNNSIYEENEKKKEVGSVVGAAVKSFIFPKEDVTALVYKGFDFARGLDVVTRSAINAFFSFPGQPFDVKKYWWTVSQKYKPLPDQTELEGHINGVMLEGKIANIDWLGHYLFGLNAQDSVSVYGAEQAAQVLSHVHQKTHESTKMQVGWTLGEESAKKLKQNRDYVFSKQETKNEIDAYEKARYRAKTYYGFRENISCIGKCNSIPGSQDVVTCIDDTGRVQEFEFNDICD